ncbi:MAG: hypothetical protein IIW42_09680, partial [Bacteroidaceae bacterium]|nr:hypothetical protein [Bacteroidaceae bacterium]
YALYEVSVRQTRCLPPASFRFFDERSEKLITTSRWTPLPWAMRFPLLGLTLDLHPVANAHSEHTDTGIESWGLLYTLVIGTGGLLLCRSCWAEDGA